MTVKQRNKNIIKDLKAGFTNQETADRNGCCKSTVNTVIRENGISKIDLVKGKQLKKLRTNYKKHRDYGKAAKHAGLDYQSAYYHLRNL